MSRIFRTFGWLSGARALIEKSRDADVLRETNQRVLHWRVVLVWLRDDEAREMRMN